ncbi:hypothetical protein LX16_1173 [Stackebrandtia albiflava]|uniref:Uncharacterized protein n=1 Tax=Stackebrandtia albiflava TaxID=406432 RepID=A0A562VC48_9ACTN|nr:hypothetical protein [Stackebrandtia albiflava]TWJ15463.1 hypothetical protein LX16_1173 [Stackebrandtia albiflava]
MGSSDPTTLTTEPADSRAVPDAERLGDAVAEYDEALLRRCTLDQRAAQVWARQVLADHFEAMWDDLEVRGASSGGEDEAAAVAVLRDLAARLLASADDVAAAAGDDPDAEYVPSEAELREERRRYKMERWMARATLEELKAAQPTANPNDVLDLADAIADLEDDLDDSPDGY